MNWEKIMNQEFDKLKESVWLDYVKLLNTKLSIVFIPYK